jgi:uncharacterized protein YndB with AHSA1/START domain
VGDCIVRYESKVVVRRPVGEVFERLADLPGYGGWMHRTGLFRRCRLTSEPPVRSGTTYVDSTWMGPFQGHVTEFERPTRISFTETLRWFGSAMSEARPAYTLEGDGDMTSVHHVAEGQLYGVMKVMKPVASWMANRERASTLRSLKRSLESE